MRLSHLRLLIGADHEGILYEINQIFREKEFIKSLETKEKYGLSYIKRNDSELKILIDRYVNTCINIANDLSRTFL